MSDEEPGTDVPVDLIEPEHNDRTTFDEGALKLLGESIITNGLVQPITVRPRTDGRTGYWLVAGERRWRAHQVVGLATIRAFVRNLDDATAQDIMLVENLARVDLNPIEEALAYRKRLDAGADLADLARVAGVTTSRVKLRLDLLRLAPEVTHLVATGQILHGLAWELRNLDHNRQLVAMRAYGQQPAMGWAGLKTLVDELFKQQTEEPMFDADQFLVLDELLEIAAKPRYVSAAAINDVAARMADALEAAGLDPQLVAEARTVIEMSTAGRKRAKAKAKASATR
jgi:ParB/RepB/Spo0J family partition protein